MQQPSLDDLKNELRRQHISVSFQRLKVLEFLVRNLDHPSVEQIYQSLCETIPTLSKTTVYNTLRILQEAGLIRPITIDDNETRFDVQIENHGHFKCETCGTIYNFSVDPMLLEAHELKGFQISDKNVYFKGICPGCLIKLDANPAKEA